MKFVKEVFRIVFCSYHLCLIQPLAVLQAIFDSDDLFEARLKDEFSFNNGSNSSNSMPSACIVDGNQNQSGVLQPNRFLGILHLLRL